MLTQSIPYGVGKRVSVEEFEGSAHCGHLLVDEREELYADTMVSI
jgi:hypothetical protein